MSPPHVSGVDGGQEEGEEEGLAHVDQHRHLPCPARMYGHACTKMWHSVVVHQHEHMPCLA